MKTYRSWLVRLCGVLAATLIMSGATTTGGVVRAMAAGDEPAASCQGQSEAFQYPANGNTEWVTAGHCPIPAGQLYSSVTAGNADYSFVAQGFFNSPPVLPNWGVADTGDFYVGQTMCSNSGPSGARCGQITDLNYGPQYVGDGYGFLLVNTSCQVGDSGGPWLIGNKAAGITSGIHDGSSCIVMRVDKQNWSNLLSKPDSTPTGYLDNCGGGWAKTDDYDGPIQVDVYADGSYVQSITADQNLGDVVGQHRFALTPPSGTHTIRVYAIGVDPNDNRDGNNPELAQSGITCTG